MSKRKCISCGEPAFAYRIEQDGSRTYLCMAHFPDTPRDAPPGPTAPQIPMPSPKPSF